MNWFDEVLSKLSFILKFWYIVLILGIIVWAVGSKVSYKTRPNKQTVSELAYTENKLCDNTVYIKENNELVPYIVVTNNYNNSGYTLLVRKYALDSEFILNEGNQYDEDDSKKKNNPYKDMITSYYPETVIFTLMNSDKYLARYDIAPLIKTVNIQVVNKEMTQAEAVEAKVFLLSASELGIERSLLNLTEGKKLSYFSKKRRVTKIQQRQINLDTNEIELVETEVSSWTRSRTISVRVGLGTVLTEDNEAKTYDVNRNSAYLRPAICIPNNTELCTVKINIPTKSGNEEKDVLYIDMYKQDKLLKEMGLLKEEIKSKNYGLDLKPTVIK